MVFQNYALYPHKTVEQNMAFALKLRKTDPAVVAERVKRAADILDLNPYLKRYPRQLSGGQRQRVAMGRAIVRNPQVFLFDEPLSNLDAKLRVQMRAEIKELHQRLGATTVYVTHDQIEAMTMADKIVVMRDGHIEQVGHPLDLYDRPANRFVASFIGSPAMNFVAGQLELPEGQAFIASDGTRIPLPLPPDLPKDVDVVLAIRPEELTIVRQNSAMAFPATVSVVEATGPETVVIASACGTRLSVVVKERSRLRPGEMIWLHPQQDKVQFFEATENGRRLSV